MEEKIILALENSDIESMKKVFSEFKLRGTEIVSTLENLQVSFEKKIEFYTAVISTDRKIDTLWEVAEWSLERRISEKPDEFLNLLSNNPNIRKNYLQYFEKHGMSEESAKNQNIIRYLLHLPEVQEGILNDENFICECFGTNPYFFENLPKQYAYLISFYNHNKFWVNSENLQKIYEKYYHEILDKEEIVELVQFQVDTHKKRSIVEMKEKDKMADVKFVLHQLQDDSNFYKDIKMIQKNRRTYFKTNTFLSKKI